MPSIAGAENKAGVSFRIVLGAIATFKGNSPRSSQMTLEEPGQWDTGNPGTGILSFKGDLGRLGRHGAGPLLLGVIQGLG